jgi:GTPase SAR1 family protein
MQVEISVKVVVIGSVGVGKSSLTVRYVHNEFNESLESTLGAVYF